MSTETGHTPGRWVWWTSNSWNRLRASQSGVDTNVLYPFVCSDGQPTIEVTPADMLLIAAAPELLDSLKALLAECERHGCFEHVSFDHPMVKPAFDKAYAIIAKAEGRS